MYGTLGPGKPNEHILREIEGTFIPASVRGHLFPEGWGAALGYPGMVLHEKGEIIKGHLFISDNLPDHWEALDAFEGEGYKRQITSVFLENGDNREAYVYVLTQAPSTIK